ncbi:hypothetical protein SAMN05192574_104352 [Mucilaginibacter gossypiicola]|uniref:Uncharacterized protein n=1 Tax=Mucilaginibacter gossypiicola TaxID=551995 RepID=A0A1H8JWK2_9SPHI|nr:hypothetical protein [Mucilaginibacter gossypiicola]SEN85134.1 hypothetical protein SAMN05192574_104352 [Mucilaginibacter gossypiicola]
MSVLNLKEDNLPLVFALMLGFIIWGLEHIVEESLKTPVIEYSVSKKIKKDTVQLIYEFSNLSREKKYSNLKILYLLDQNQRIYTGSYVPDRLAVEDQNDVPFYIDTTHNEGVFNIKTVQPLASFKIILNIRNDTLPEIRYATEETIILKEYSLDVFLVKNEFIVIFVLIIIFIVSLTFYAIKFKPNETR